MEATNPKTTEAPLHEKSFDAVQMMRDIRQNISTETENMTFEQLKAYMREKLEKL